MQELKGIKPSDFLDDLKCLDFCDNLPFLYAKNRDTPPETEDAVSQGAVDAFVTTWKQDIDAMSSNRYRIRNSYNDQLRTSYKANDDKTQAIFDYYYEVMKFRRCASKQLASMHDYLDDFVNGRQVNSNYDAYCGLVGGYAYPVKDDVFRDAVNKYSSYGRLVPKGYKFPAIALWYTMIAVIVNDSGIVGFRLYDWLTDTAADYTYDSIKQRLLEASVRITNLEVINNNLICTQGKFDYYAKVHEDGTLVGIYSPLVFLTCIRTITSPGGIFVDYLGNAGWYDFSLSLLSIGVANLVLDFSCRTTVKSYFDKSDIVFGIEPLIPGEDYAGSMQRAFSPVRKLTYAMMQRYWKFFPNDTGSYGYYRAYSPVAFNDNKLQGALYDTDESTRSNYVFAGYGFGYYNGEFVQYIVPVERTAIMRLDSESMIDKDYTTPCENLASILPVYPVLDSSNVFQLAGSEQITTTGVIVKSTNNYIYDVLKYNKNVARWAGIQMIDETDDYAKINGVTKRVLPVRTFRNAVVPRGFFDMPYCLVRQWDKITRVMSALSFVSVGNRDDEEANAVYLAQLSDRNNAASDTLFVKMQNFITLDDLTCPVAICSGNSSDVKLSGNPSMVYCVSDFRTMVINIVSPCAPLRIQARSATVKNLIINGNLRFIVANAFANKWSELHTARYCSLMLHNVLLPDSIESIGQNAFSRQSELTTLNIPKSTKIINSSAFMMCEKLKNIELPDGLRVIGSWAFAGCESLGSIVIPASVTFIGANAFKDCNLQSVTFLGDITKIDIAEDAFIGNSPSVMSQVAPVEGKTFKRYNGNLLGPRNLAASAMQDLKSTTAENPNNRVYTKHLEPLYPGYSFNKMHIRNYKFTLLKKEKGISMERFIQVSSTGAAK